MVELRDAPHEALLEQPAAEGHVKLGVEAAVCGRALEAEGEGAVRLRRQARDEPLRALLREPLHGVVRERLAALVAHPMRVERRAKRVLAPAAQLAQRQLRRLLGLRRRATAVAARLGL